MNISGSTVLVTGANRGLGRIFVEQVLDRGARKVYATARRVESLDDLLRSDRIVPVQLDITDVDAVTAAASVAADVDLVVNNAGIATAQNLLTGDLGLIRSELDTHFWGTLAMSRAFAPILARNGGGGIINLMSLLSFRAYPGNGAYAAAKAAQWQLTNSTRLELAGQGTQVLGVHLSSTDTDMMAGWDVPKADPVQAVRSILDAFESGAQEFLDAETSAVKSLLNEPPEVLYSAFSATS
jgi:NAD(P)-dependent dehydrogenase (short-subunit alcohol dehydrogenase family)